MAVAHRNRKKRVAIIGSGLAGLSAAHLLTLQDQVEVHIFEKAQSIGMDSASIDVAGNDGKIHRVDSPMRAVQGGYYTHLLKLYKSLGVQLEKSNFTYSFFELSTSSSSSSSSSWTNDRRDHPQTVRSSREDLSECQPARSNGYMNGNGFPDDEKKARTKKKTTFIYNGGNGISLRPVGFPSNGHSLEHALSYLSILNVLFYFYDMVHIIYKSSLFASCYIYLTILSFYHVYTFHTSPTSTHPISRSTLSQFLSSTYLPRSFINEILIPLFACVATCSPSELMEYPAAEILEYIARTFGTDHYIVKGGVKNAVRKLIKDVPLENIHLGCELVSMRKGKNDDGNGNRVLELKETSGRIWEFDNVIFATQANQARFLLADYYTSLKEDSGKDIDSAEFSLEKERLDALGKFSYTTSIVVNHYDDASTLVDDAQDRRILNLARWNARDLPSPSFSTTKTNAIIEEEKLSSSNQKRLKKEHIMATHDLSILHPNCRSPSPNNAPLLQTTNPTVSIEESTIVSSQVFERAKLTLESKETLKEFMKYSNTSNHHTGSSKDSGSSASTTTTTKCFQGLGGIYFVGSWAAEGIPLLEGCVVSAERAVNALCQ